MSTATPNDLGAEAIASALETLDDALDLPLDPPVRVKGVDYAVLHLAEPRAQQVRMAEKCVDANGSDASVTEYQIELIRQVTKAPKEVVEALTARQLGQAANFLADFVDGDPYVDLENEPEPPPVFEQPLDPPLTWNGGTIAALTLREPTAGELRSARGFMRTGITLYSHRTYEMELLQMVTGLNPAVIHGLRIRDFIRASRRLAVFIAAGRRAGKRSPSS